ncbi:MAG: thioredoxin family protein [Anaerolineae bacterium]|nr:thioredoxin family protein [Anaerolineae bacterium]MDW8173539.1 thioredoxin family protein [Anaerolineae bacterium]
MDHRVKLLSDGSLEARRLEAEAVIVLETLGLNYSFEIVTDFLTIINYPVKGTPALVIDGCVVWSGATPSRARLREAVLSVLRMAASA